MSEWWNVTPNYTVPTVDTSQILNGTCSHYLMDGSWIQAALCPQEQALTFGGFTWFYAIAYTLILGLVYIESNDPYLTLIVGIILWAVALALFPPGIVPITAILVIIGIGALLYKIAGLV